MKQEIEQEKLTDTETDKEHNNPFNKVILNKVYRDEDKMMQMENWSILSNNVRYVQHDEKTSHRLNINTLAYCQNKELYYKLKGEKSHMLDVDFSSSPETMRSSYLDMYEVVHADMIYTNRFDENSDLNTAYLEQRKMTRETRIKVEEKISITGQGYTLEKLLDGTECQSL